MSGMRFGTKSQIFLAGLGLALCAFALEWFEYQYFVRAFSTDIYIAVLVSAFTMFGVWAGHKLSQKRAGLDQFECNEKAIENLGVTRREYAVLTSLAKGHSNKQIARDLGISPNTVKTHITNLYAKLKVNGRIQAISAARELQILGS